MEMMREALAVARDNDGLWAEFGVASGKSTAYIAQVMDKTFPGGSKVGNSLSSFFSPSLYTLLFIYLFGGLEET